LINSDGDPLQYNCCLRKKVAKQKELHEEVRIIC